MTSKKNSSNNNSTAAAAGNNNNNNNDTKPDNYQINAKICRLVENYPCLYDRSHTHYSKKDVVDKAWVKIAKEMDDSIPSCKERWRNIRTSFARSINVNKTPASANRTKPYYLHEELQFLARHITPGIPVSRRSNNASYYSAGEESEVIEVSVGGESFDGFAAAMTNGDEEDSQDKKSSIDENGETAIKNEMLEKSAQQLREETENVSKSPLEDMEKLPKIAAELVLEKEVVEKVETPLITIYPPKKRQRMLEAAMMREPTPEKEIRDVKPSELLPDSDFDANFLQGLLPEVKAMDFRQKLIFKRRIYEVIGEIFENTATSSRNSTPQQHHVQSTSTSPNTMTIINTQDLAMIHRINSLLDSPNTTIASSTSSTVTAVPKNAVSSISSTVRTTPPGTNSIAAHRGALTRSSTNLLRVTMLNPTPMPISSTQVKQEQLEVLDD